MSGRKLIWLAIASSLVASACATPATPAKKYYRAASSDLGDLVYAATAKLADSALNNARENPRLEVSLKRPVIVSTMVSVDNLDRSSTFGRLASQLVVSRLAQEGYLVRDVTYQGGMLDINPNGELVLSRDAAKLSREYGAQAIVAGTYAVGGESIYLSLRMLRAADGAVIASSDVAIPLNRNTAPLVRMSSSWTDEPTLKGGMALAR